MHRSHFCRAHADGHRPVSRDPVPDHLLWAGERATMYQPVSSPGRGELDQTTFRVSSSSDIVWFYCKLRVWLCSDAQGKLFFKGILMFQEPRKEFEGHR